MNFNATSDKKKLAILLRKEGNSLRFIATNLGIPLSTVSGWVKDIALSQNQKQILIEKQKRGLHVARPKASDWHKAQKVLRLYTAKQEAEGVINRMHTNADLLDIALAMLYFGEGKKADYNTGIANSNPLLLQFVIAVLRRNYNISLSDIRCELHLRVDQDAEELKSYWSTALAIPKAQFVSVVRDAHSNGKATYPTYKGVCVLRCGSVAIQRKLVYLYTLFCEKIASESGAISSVG